MEHEPVPQRRIRGIFDFEDDTSPIAAAVQTEIARQASNLIKFACGLDADVDASAAPIDAAMRAIFDEIDSYDSGQPLLMLTSASASAPVPTPAHTIARSRTVAHGNTLSPTWTPTRACSAKAILGRQRSRTSNACLQIPPDRSNSDVARAVAQSGSRGLAARVGAIAASPSSENNALMRSRSSLRVSSVQESRSSSSENIAHMCVAAELIERKFRKHVTCAECEDGFVCMCKQDCESPARLWCERYGRLRNPAYIPPGYYDPAHLVDLFIDAYDAEKIMDRED